MTRTLFALLLLPALAACDSTASEPEPEPGSPLATVTVDLETITAVRDCDGGSNPGDFHFQISFVDGRNQSIGSVVEIPTGTYGTDGSASNTIQLTDGESLPINQSVSFSLPEETGSAFTVTLSMIEWESATTRDPQADDVSRLRTYEYRDGRFQSIAGDQTLFVYGTNSSACQASLSYGIRVD